MRIRRLSDEPPVALAVEELAEYLERITGVRPSVEGRDRSEPDGRALRVGTADDLPGDVSLPDVENPSLDDAIAVETDGAEGIVAGNNPRAVLLAAYRYLRAVGCRWVRPGPDGEIVPHREELPAVSLEAAPDSRYRGISVGGGESERRLRELIEWVPRVGYNAAMIEFFEGELFKKTRDRRRGQPTVPDEHMADERALSLHEAAVDAIEERGLSYHAVGHNWTATVLGMADQPREADDGAVPADRREYLAEVDGERTLFGRGPLDTELCYSNPAVRERFADAVASYAADHPEIGVLHVWLSDGHNNHCECPECRGTRPSDYYVRMLNAVDRRLTERGLDTRIAFLAYTDLLWPPEEERLENEDRFALMFAPIHRTYDADWSAADPGKIPPYERNHLDFPADLSENVAFLEAWRDAFRGDGFVFDYHYWRAQFRDPGGVRIAEVATEDARRLGEIGLDGSVSCNVQRSFFPHGLGMAGTAAALWDREVDFDSFAAGYADAAYGENGADALEHLQALSGLVDEAPIRSGERATEVASAFASIREAIEEADPLIERNRELTAGARARSWELLGVHSGIWSRLAAALEARAEGRNELASERWEGLKAHLRDRSEELAPTFDLHLFESTFRGLFEEN